MIAKKLSEYSINREIALVIKCCSLSYVEKRVDSHKLISDKLAKQKEFEKRSEKFEKMKKSEKVGHLEAEMMTKIRVGLDSIALNDKHREALYGMDMVSIGNHYCLIRNNTIVSSCNYKNCQTVFIHCCHDQLTMLF